MRSPLHGSNPPYTLRSNVVYFHDWRYVDPGGFGGPGGFTWVDDTGKRWPLWTDQVVPASLRMEPGCVPYGISLAAQPASRTEPFITAGEVPGEYLDSGRCTVIHEDGRYRLWYDGWCPEDLNNPLAMGNFNLMRYAESDDGMNWKFPQLGFMEYRGNRDNNIVYGGCSHLRNYHGGGVFKDPSAPPEERYKAIYMGLVPEDVVERFKVERPEAVDPSPFGADHHYGLYGAVSPDGLRWTPLSDPLVIQTSDTQNVCTYDEVLGKYVAYVRSWYHYRRSIGRMESDDFRRFPVCEEIFWPGPSGEPSDLWYANGKTIMPGTVDYHLMFPLRWSLTDDRWDFPLATSPDGIVWSIVPGGPVCRPSGLPGAPDAELVAASVGMVRLPGGRTGMPLGEWPVPHKFPRTPPMGAIAWAWWPEDRLVALQSPREGAFSLFPLKFQGRRVHLNFKTTRSGHVQVQALDHERKALPGRSFEECDFLNGDTLDRLVTWRGESDLGHADGLPVILQFKLRAADLFSIKFE